MAKNMQGGASALKAPSATGVDATARRREVFGTQTRYNPGYNGPDLAAAETNTNLPTVARTPGNAAPSSRGSIISGLDPTKKKILVAGGVLLFFAVLGIILGTTLGGDDAIAVNGSDSSSSTTSADNSMQDAPGEDARGEATIDPEPFLPLEPGSLAAGTHRIQLSGALGLFTIVKKSAVSAAHVPCARSYEGHPWETVRPRDGPLPLRVQITSCENTALTAEQVVVKYCAVTIPEGDTGYTYTFNVVDLSEKYAASSNTDPSSAYWHDRTASQLLAQATFGPTLDEIHALSSKTQQKDPQQIVEDWIAAQIAAPPTLHREYYRRRANARLDAPTEAGVPRSACMPNSRWNRIAISSIDQSYNISFSEVPIPNGNTGATVTAMYINGVLRSEVDLTMMRPYGLGDQVTKKPQNDENCNWCQNGGLELDKTYVICRIEEAEMSEVVLGTSCIPNLYPSAVDRTVIYNQLMKFEHLPYPTVDRRGQPIELLDLASAADADIHTLPPTRFNTGVLIVNRMNVPCPFSWRAQTNPFTTIKYNGLYYMYDPRLKMLDNTVESPANPESISISGEQRTCPTIAPTAPRTFLNEDTCIVAHGCQPDQFSDTMFELNAANIRQFFEAGNNFVYAVDSLPMDPQEEPCGKQPTRWRKLDGADCSAHGGASTLDTSSISVLTDVFRASTDTNVYVKDIELTNEERALCTATAHGARLEVDNQCWQHTHKDTLSVYDFTLWAMEHGGNTAQTGFFPIKKVAVDGEAVLHFPDWHALSRWKGNTNADFRSVKLAFGRFGDKIRFNDLPEPVRSAGFAEAVGVTLSPNQDTEWVEMCGSPGEVANDPTLANHWWFGKETWSNVGAYNQQELLPNFKSMSGSNQRQKIHTMISLHAPDQLRQRVAWALSQTFAVGDAGSVVLQDHGEIWTYYYDIFVRHAFGSYFDVLREVSFNPVMAYWLTFEGSESYSYKASVPDENYAREIMQLFSIGLWRMHQDGTDEVNADGEKIPTYTNEAIVEFAKAWTGFRSRRYRGNLELKRIAKGNMLDNLELFPERRDITPKMDLHRAYIGDGMPLCNDLGPRHFLRVGAKFRYLGKEGKPDITSGRDSYDYSAEGDPSGNQPFFTPNPATSELHAALCNPTSNTGKCSFKSIVTLATNLACDGKECEEADGGTIRVVKIMDGGKPYYYEYQPVPCVSLAFFAGAEGGRFIESVNNLPAHGSDDALIERICADPKAAIATPACCTQAGALCFQYPCNHVDERLPFVDAKQRCIDRMDTWKEEQPGFPAFPSSPTPLTADWNLYPTNYHEPVTGCPAGSSVPSEDECFFAAASAMKAAGEPHFENPAWNFFGPNKDQYRLGEMKTGDWANLPHGCWISVHSRIVQYNYNTGGGNCDDCKLVCDLPDSEPAPDLSDASPVLCSRKRRHCWFSSEDNCHGGFSFGGHMTENPYYWQEEKCVLQAQINIDGRVSIVHPGGESVRRFEVNSQNWFLARWYDGVFPSAATGCGGADDGTCSVVKGDSGDTCVCDIKMTTAVVFTDATAVPSQPEVEEALRIGAPPPHHFDDGVYTLCETNACTAARPDVKVYTTGSSSTPTFDERAIFEIMVNKTTPQYGFTKYFMNKQSIVTIASADSDAAFSFRNPPQIMKAVSPTVRDALYETDALLDHLFHHTNVPPFVATRLIQRLVASNPSPRYVRAVADAFVTGSYNGKMYSGKYGDMGAATAATLLDREARSLVLAADPTHGQIREPLLKLLHFMRSMEYSSRDNRDVELHSNIVGKIGQGVYLSPTVFSFFKPEYTPEGPVQDTGLVAPEAQLGILPYMIGYLDGMTSLIHDGLSSCLGGFGPGHGCTKETYPADFGAPYANEGFLKYVPSNPATADDVINELDLLLNAGRLDDFSRSVIKSEYTRVFNLSSCPVDKSAELCGRLVPGDTLNSGEHIVNSFGEVLCVSYDQVARHIGADGTLISTTAPITRHDTKIAYPLRYESEGNLYLGGLIESGKKGERVTGEKWTNGRYHYTAGNYNLFHAFLSGPCVKMDENRYKLRTVNGYADFGYENEIITCTAKSTCDAANKPPVPTVDPAAERAKTDGTYALRVAQNLIAASAAFATTNEPATDPAVSIPPPPPRPFTNKEYKAVVVLFMAGGADTFNLLIPKGNCDNRNVSVQYTTTRGNAALPLESTRTIHVNAGKQNVVQPCGTFGLHPEHSVLQELWDEGDAAFVANVGPLVEPMNKQEYLDRKKRIPKAIFSHNIQTQGAKTLTPETTTGKTGVLGRMLAALDKQAEAPGATPLKTSAYSISSDRTMFRGSPVEPILLTSYEGMLTYKGSQTATYSNNQEERAQYLELYKTLASQKAGSIFADTHNTVVRNALFDSSRISKLLENATLNQNWDAAINSASSGHGKDFVAQLKQVSMVVAARKAFEAERDVFYIELGGFDNHADVQENVKTKFRDINAGLRAFVAEMKDLGVWDNVVLQSSSEFGRTMTSNGRGTDHAWGGNHFTIGGSVKGGIIHGEYPELRIDGPQSVSSTGPMLPTSPWESIYLPLAQWLGVEDGQMDNVLPNLKNFKDYRHLLNQQDTFA